MWFKYQANRVVSLTPLGSPYSVFTTLLAETATHIIYLARRDSCFYNGIGACPGVLLFSSNINNNNDDDDDDDDDDDEDDDDDDNYHFYRTYPVLTCVLKSVAWTVFHFHFHFPSQLRSVWLFRFLIFFWVPATQPIRDLVARVFRALAAGYVICLKLQVTSAWLPCAV